VWRRVGRGSGKTLGRAASQARGGTAAMRPTIYLVRLLRITPLKRKATHVPPSNSVVNPLMYLRSPSTMNATRKLYGHLLTN
jgi:hypothetical protein